MTNTSNWCVSGYYHDPVTGKMKMIDYTVIDKTIEEALDKAKQHGIVDIFKIKKINEK